MKKEEWNKEHDDGKFIEEALIVYNID